VQLGLRANWRTICLARAHQTFAIAALTFLSGILAGIALQPRTIVRQIAFGGEKLWAKRCW
jgi:hypothetical protein